MRCRAFTLLETLLALAIVAVLVALTIPALAGAREQARLVGCSSNMRSLLLATLMYVDGEGRGSFPAVRNPMPAFKSRPEMLPAVGAILSEPVRALASYLELPPMVVGEIPVSPALRCPADRKWGTRYGVSYLFVPCLLTSDADREYPLPGQVREQTLKYDLRLPYYDPVWWDFDPTFHLRVVPRGRSGRSVIRYDGGIVWGEDSPEAVEQWTRRHPADP